MKSSSCLRTYLFEKVLRLIFRLDSVLYIVWGPTCLRRYWDLIFVALQQFLPSEDLPVWEGIETNKNVGFLSGEKSEDLPVWEGIETLNRFLPFGRIYVWGPTCLRRYWDEGKVIYVLPKGSLRTYLFEKVLRRNRRLYRTSSTVWGPTCLRRYWDINQCSNKRICMSEDLPVWEGIETSVDLSSSFLSGLRTYLFEKVLRPIVWFMCTSSKVWGPTCLRRYWDGRTCRIFGSDCLRTYLFEKVLRLSPKNYCSSDTVWGPTCLRRYWDIKATAIPLSILVWGPTCLRRYWDNFQYSWAHLHKSEDLPVWEGIETFGQTRLANRQRLRTYLFEKVLRHNETSFSDRFKVWGPTCLRRYWDTTYVYSFTSRKGLRTYLFEKVLRLKRWCIRIAVKVWGPTCLRRYWDHNSLPQDYTILSEDLPVWEGIETLLFADIDAGYCLRTYLFEKVLRHILWAFQLHCPSEDLPVWEGIETTCGGLDRRCPEVWGPTCLRRYWDCHGSALTDWAMSEDLPVWEGIETWFCAHSTPSIMSEDLPVWEGIETPNSFGQPPTPVWGPTCLRRYWDSSIVLFASPLGLRTYLFEKVLRQ